MAALLTEIHYLPSIAWFAAMAQADELVIEQCEHYQKQTYRNRCHVRGANRVETLTVPLTGRRGKTVITDVQIDYRQRWMETHWRTIESAYRKSPFFEHYEEELHTVLFAGTPTLFELNWSLLNACMQWLGLEVPIKKTTTFKKTADPGTWDKRNFVDAKHPARFAGVFRARPYQQVFGNTFVENLSIIDLLFCVGPGSLEIVKASACPAV